jgi:hypothetical protein
MVGAVVSDLTTDAHVNRVTVSGLLTGEWVIDRTTAEQRQIIHHWSRIMVTIFWLTAGPGLWITLRDARWFVGFMSLSAIRITHLAGWAAETRTTERQDAARVRCLCGSPVWVFSAR